MPTADPTQRFSSRVENYVRYRPGYPPEVLELLKTECGLNPESMIADIGSGTGILTRIFLENGNRVFAVEPNAAMREAAEKVLTSFPGFSSVSGRSEATTLPGQSVNFVTAGQAAHWFDPKPTRMEFKRILRPAGWVVLVWNERSTDATPFLHAYEKTLISYGTDYQEVRHERTTQDLNAFFGPSVYRERVFQMQQEFDYPGFEGRVLSSSYAPGPDHPKHQPMLTELRRIFGEYQVEGRVSMDYQTRVYYGQLE